MSTHKNAAAIMGAASAIGATSTLKLTFKCISKLCKEKRILYAIPTEETMCACGRLMYLVKTEVNVKTKKAKRPLKGE